MEGTIGTMILFAANFAPRNWALCQGQLLPINANQALFSILGTTYGGDGRTSFGLPDLRGRVPIQQGTGAGLSTHSLGAKGGTNFTALTAANLPAHTHGAVLKVSDADANISTPVAGVAIAAPGATVARAFTGTDGFVPAAPNVDLNPASVVVGSTGSGVSFTNMEPYLGLNYIICLQGLFPSRN